MTYCVFVQIKKLSIEGKLPSEIMKTLNSIIYCLSLFWWNRLSKGNRKPSENATIVIPAKTHSPISKGHYYTEDGRDDMWYCEKRYVYQLSWGLASQQESLSVFHRLCRHSPIFLLFLLCPYTLHCRYSYGL